MLRINNRLKKLESISGDDWSRLGKYLNTYYDEAPEAIKDLYCQLLRTERTALEEVWLAVLGDLHFSMQKCEPPTKAELQEIIEEVKQKVFTI